MNDITWKAVKRVQIPAVKEPVGLTYDGKRADGATLISWARGKPLVWDVTVTDTHTDFNIHNTVRQAGAATDQAAENKCTEYRTLEGTHVEAAVELWKAMTKQEVPEGPASCFQRRWDLEVTTVVHQDLLSRCVNEVNVGRMKAEGPPLAGDWLNAPPITAMELRLSDEAIRVAVGYRLGSATCQPHTCVCGSKVDARGLHRLSCRKSTPRNTRLYSSTT